ncbi:hypothetical protein ACF09L_32775 [Streptomyces sp. NPDC014779]
MTEPPLAEDEQAWLDLHASRHAPLADHGRPAGRPHPPHDRQVEDVLETL